MNKIRYIISTIFIMLVIHAATAQDDYHQNIKGRVLDKDSHQPLPGATVSIVGSRPLKGTTTDNKGFFKLKNVKLGRVTLKISYIGYKPVVISNILLESGKEKFINIKLEEKVIEAEMVEIRAKRDKSRPINQMASVSARSFSVEETRRYAGSMGDPSRMVSNFAGVATVDDSRNDIVIRGNSPSGLLWRLEGIDIPNPNHFGALGTSGGPVSMLNNNLLDNSDFLTGAFPAEYGNALSGAFDLQMRSGNRDKFEFVGQIGFNGFEFGAEGPISKKTGASFLVNYRYSTMQVISNLGFDTGAGSSVPDYQDLTLKVDIPTEKFGKFTLLALGGLSEIKIYDSEKDSSEFSFGLAGTDTDYGSDMGLIALKNEFFVDENTRITTSLSLNGIRNTTYIDSLDENVSGGKYPYLRLNAKKVTTSAKAEITRKFSARDNATLGFQYKMIDINQVDSVWTHEDQAFRNFLDVNETTSLSQMWFQWQHKFTDQFLLNAGLHSMSFSLNDEVTVEPRAGLQYELSPKHLFSLGYGYHSKIHPLQMYFIKTRLNSNNYILTNKDMKMTKAHHLVAGYDLSLGNHARLKTEIYYQWINDVPASPKREEFSMLNTGAFFNIPLYDSLVNRGTGRNYGLEITLERFFFNNYYFLTTVSLFQSKYTDLNGVERNTMFNNEYVINALAGYEWITGKHSALTIDARGVYAGGRYYKPIDKQASTQANDIRYDWERAYTKKNDDYFRVDVKIGFKLQGKKVNQEWALDLRNVTDQKNVFMRNWDPVNQSVRIDYQQGFYPMMLWRIQF